MKREVKEMARDSKKSVTDKVDFVTKPNLDTPSTEASGSTTTTGPRDLIPRDTMSKVKDAMTSDTTRMVNITSLAESKTKLAVDQIKVSLEDLKVKVYDMKDKLDDVSKIGDQTHHIIKHEIASVQDKVIVDAISKVTAAPATKTRVAFTAGLTSYTSYDSWTTVKFDKVMTNVGSVYSPATGQFVAPVSGLYAFAVFTQGNASTFAIVLRVDGQRKVCAWADRTPDMGNARPAAANALMVRLTQGQTVDVEGYGKAAGFNVPTCTFSGALLCED